jgi:hypothetical protein
MPFSASLEHRLASHDEGFLQRHSQATLGERNQLRKDSIVSISEQNPDRTPANYVSLSPGAQARAARWAIIRHAAGVTDANIIAGAPRVSHTFKCRCLELSE